MQLFLLESVRQESCTDIYLTYLCVSLFIYFQLTLGTVTQGFLLEEQQLQKPPVDVYVHSTCVPTACVLCSSLPTDCAW